MILPRSQEKLIPWAQEIISRCRASVGARSAMAKSQRQWLMTGSPDGNSAIVNKLGPHVDRLASYLFSPNDLRFHMDFTHSYPKAELDKAEVAARVLTRVFEQRDIDIEFGKGVQVALSYGACIPKLMDAKGGMVCKLCMPWQIGVYREDQEGFAQQEAVSETNYITPFDLWRRISHMPGAEAMFKKAMAYAKKNSQSDDSESFFHQVLIAGTPPVVQTDPPFMTQPGGLVQVTSDPTGAIIAPEVAGELMAFHELWVWDDERQDYTTIQMIEPDILIAPLYRRANMFVPEYLPYGMIQPNQMQGYFWGRSEIADLMKLQHLLRDRMEDIKRLMGLQYDRLIAFEGGSGMTDEMYDQFRQSGWIALEPGMKVNDLTPALPKEAFADIQEIVTFMDEIAGFGNILSGQGEPGVRAGNHAQTLLRTASPRLRDRALLVERQCADLADKAFQLLAAKEAKAYWTPNGGEETEFLLSQIPEDYRIMVDSHSSSPIYEEDHRETAAFLAKQGVIDGESLLDLLAVPMRDILKERYRELQKSRAQHQQDMIKEAEKHPEVLKLLKGGKH